MSNFDETVIRRLTALEREVERLRVGDRAIVITDHGALSGLADNDHPQYQLKDGWIPVSGTWTYASATTITVPSGAASIYKVGQGIRLTQSSTVKYFYIVGVTDTVLTITGGSDYTLANATISAVSYTNTPATAIGFPDIFNYTPVVTYLGGTTNPTGWTNLTAQFSINGRTATVRINGQLNRGSGDRNYVLFSEPVACANVSAGSCYHELVNSIPVVGVNWADIHTINVYLGGAMNYNGSLFININYQI